MPDLPERETTARDTRQKEAMHLPDLFRNPEFYVPFAAGETVFREGEPGDLMYVIIEGRVEIQIRGNVIAVFGQGEVLGEMGVIDTQPRSATALALTDCRLAPINEKRFLLLTKQTPEFALHLLRVLTKRLRQMDAYIERSDRG